MSRPLHIAMFNPTAFGGHARYTHELLLALHAEGGADVRLSLVTNRDLDPHLRDAPYAIHGVLPALAPLEAFPTRLHWMAGRTRHYLRRDEALLSWVRSSGDVDIVHYQLPPLLRRAHFSRMKAAGARVAATVHNVQPHRYAVPLARPVADWFAHSGWRSCNLLFVHSDRLRALLEEKLGHRAPPIRVTRHGIWSVDRNDAPPQEARLAAKTLLLFGVQRRNKGLHVMLDALGRLPGFRLILAGGFDDPSLHGEVRSRIQADALPVELMDSYVPEAQIASVFSRATLAVLPYTDFFAESGALYMALSYGVPVVVSDVGALGETVRRLGVGRVAPTGDPAAFAEAVRSAIDPAAYAAAARACDVLSAAGWRETARATLEGYRALASTPAR